MVIAVSSQQMHKIHDRDVGLQKHELQSIYAVQYTKILLRSLYMRYYWEIRQVYSLHIIPYMYRCLCVCVCVYAERVIYF